MHMIPPFFFSRSPYHERSSAFYYCDRAELHSLLRNPRVVTRVDNFRHVLVAVGCFFRDKLGARDSDGNPLFP